MWERGGGGEGERRREREREREVGGWGIGRMSKLSDNVQTDMHEYQCFKPAQN